MSDQTESELSGEERLIARYFRPLATHPGAFGLIDDAAALTPPTACDLVLKTDGLICGVHFFASDPADAVAKKALRVNLSDLVDVERVPLSDAARTACARESALLETVLTGGDDYEIIATLPPESIDAFGHAALAAGVAATEIGVVTAGDGIVRLVDRNGNALRFAQSSFSHF